MIKPVDEIPQNIGQKRESYRQNIRGDIQEAIDNGIPRFEFVGDYKYKYLANYAREEARNVLYKMARDRFKRMSGDGTIYLSSLDLKTENYIRVSSLKGETPEKTRVFCEIDLSGLDDDLEALAEEKREQAEAYRKNQERRKLAMVANDEEEKLEVLLP